MKKRFLILLIVLFSFMLIPIKTNAAKNDKATIYLFRGKGCGYCRALLTFLNSINDDYADMYDLVSFETWNNQDNYELMGKISSFLEQPAQGVPYLIIGDKVFPGYANVYDEDIKSAIKDLYNTDKSKRYDVFEAYNKKGNNVKLSSYKTLDFKEALKEEGIEYNTPKKSSSNGTSSKAVIIWNLVFTVLATSTILVFVNSKFKKLNKNIELSMKKTNKVEKK